MNKPVDPRETALLATYDPRRYAPVSVTVDVAVLTIRDGVFSVLLVPRANPPFAGMWCLPGGFLKPNDEGEFSSLSVAAAARLAIETGLHADVDENSGAHLEQLATFGAPGRDPRMHVISVAYLAFAPDLPEPVAGPSTIEAAWTPVETALGMDLAFDHREILASAVTRARGKLEYTTAAIAFLPLEFSLPDLQRVYEIVWGETLKAPDFRRKILATKRFVEPVGKITTRGGISGGRRAVLYRAGGGNQMLPPILSQATKDALR